MDSRARTRAVSRKEWLLGHLIGPLGLIFVVNTIAALVEKFFTQQVGIMYGQGNIDMVMQMGNTYEVIMTVAKLLAVGMGLLNGWLVQHTKSKQGRMRPWLLIFGFCSLIIGGLIFLFPGTRLGENYWFYFFTLLISYHTIGSVYFFVFRDTIVSLISRDPSEKMKVKFIRQLCWTLISGIVIGMLISMVAIPMWLEKDIHGYAILLIILSLIGIPLLLMEYYYTRERVTEAYADEVGLENENKIPLKDQLKAIFTNKYLVILFLFATVQGIVDNFKGGNVQFFYIKFLLNGENNYGMYSIFQIVTGIPLGIGAFAIYPLAKKFGVKNVSLVGYIMVLLGSVAGWLFPSNLPVVLVSGFIRNIGWLPNAYIFATLILYAYDDAEFKSNIRLEGLLGVAIVVAIQHLIYAPFAGGYESAILKLGFVDAEGVTASSEVRNFMSLAFYLFDIIAAAIFVILLPFVNVEKKLPTIKAELIRRQKEAVLARGDTWIEPEELERQELEEAKKKTEENRILDLKETCQRKGLDFETENQKYLEKVRIKEEKQKAKALKKKK